MDLIDNNKDRRDLIIIKDANNKEDHYSSIGSK
nr:MAG TPA: hypothetical protein [Caudoviricetes sp.]